MVTTQLIFVVSPIGAATVHMNYLPGVQFSSSTLIGDSLYSNSSRLSHFFHVSSVAAVIGPKNALQSPFSFELACLPGIAARQTDGRTDRQNYRGSTAEGSYEMNLNLDMYHLMS